MVSRRRSDLRTEGAGPEREAAAIGLGVFIGASPFYGAHLLLCWIIGRLFHLNRLKMYLAANISNPFVAPWLIFSELQTGAWVRRGELHAVTLDAVRGTNPWVFGLDLLAGSVVVGGSSRWLLPAPPMRLLVGAKPVMPLPRWSRARPTVTSAPASPPGNLRGPSCSGIRSIVPSSAADG